MDIPVIFRYLKDLAANNNRDWFNAHRDAYESARSEFENLLTAVIARISTFDETIRGIEAKDCTYRIYRDTRFSQDKTPYKIHMGGYINAKGKNQIIVATTSICNPVTVCWPEEAIVPLLPC